jgi:CHAT domain-containing protein
MKDNALILEINRLKTLNNASEAIISISFNEDGDNKPSIYSYQKHHISLVSINQQVKDMIEFINSTQSSGSRANLHQSLEQKGRLLCNDVLPNEVKKILIESKAEYLIIDVDDHLVHFPFELFYLKDCFLCEKFAIGRRVRTQQTVQFIQRDRKPPFSFWVVNNPTKDLSHAAKEGKEIRSVLKQYLSKKNQLSPIKQFRLDSNISKEHIKSRICDHDIMHFAGHGIFDQNVPGQSGWQFSDGLFTADDIKKLACNKPLPCLVFSNACQSGRTESWDFHTDDQAAIYGIANAFKLSGVLHYVGTFWNIPDNTSQSFAKIFYQKLMKGKTIGMAMLSARKALIANHQDLCWASYHLYGDPRISYVEKSDIDDDLEIEPDKTEKEIGKKIDTKPPPVREGVSSKKATTPHWLWTVICCTLILIIIGLWVQQPSHSPNLIIDEWTSKEKAVAVLFDPHDNLLTDQIQEIMCNEFTQEIFQIKRFIILERIDIKPIKQELDLWLSKYSSQKAGYIPNIIPCDLLIFVDVLPTVQDSKVYIKLLRPADSKQKELIISTLDSSHLFGPYTEISKKLVDTLLKLYPLQGIIKDTSDPILLNIGSNVGVEVDQTYKVIDHQVTLTIESVLSNSSKATILKGNKTVVKGWKVRLQEHSP